MTNYNSTLQSNNTDLQEVLQILQNKASSGGAELPTLANEGTAANLLSGKELIDGSGKIVTGSMPNNGTIEMTMDGIDTKTISIPEGYTSGGTISLDGTIDEEVEEQTDLIEQIKNAVNNLPEAGSGGNEPVGVCPSLTITVEAVDIESVAFVNNGIYKSGLILDPSMSAICQNADIGQPVIINAYGGMAGNMVPKNYTNLEILYSDGQTIIAKCISTDPATLTIYDFDPNTGG